MSLARRCSRTACGRAAVNTLTYVYADQTAVLGPLATYAEPHAYDLCDLHSERLSAPRGWEVLRLAPDPTARYQRAADVLDDILAFRDTPVQPVRRPRAAGVATAEDRVAEIQSRLKARETPQASFCWHCRKPLQARTAKCPFCGEAQ